MAPEEANEVHALYAVPESLTALDGDAFLDHPWPSDLRREADGTVRLEGYPNPIPVRLISAYVASMKGVLDGFSPVAAGYLRFDGPLDTSSLPGTPLDALSPDATVQLIDVDPASPDKGTRQRVSLQWRRDTGVYWQANTLTFLPTFGFPLRPATRYALVVTRGVRAEDGRSVAPPPALRAALGLAPAETAAVSSHALALGPALTELEAAGVPREHIANLAVFTTGDPAGDVRRMRDWMLTSYPAPRVESWGAAEQDPNGFAVYEGVYGPSPDFQQGTPPFLQEGGAFAFDAAGAPVVQRDLSLRFALAVPDASTCPMPSEGYPIVVYAHGTGGDYRSFVRREARMLAKQCLASMGIDQIFHGTRAGSDTPNIEMVVFNINNPAASRANLPQSALDVVQQARLFTESALEVAADLSLGGKALRFDPSRVLFMGHSQGGLNGSIFLGIDGQTRGGVLSGTGSMVTVTLLERPDIAPLVAMLILGTRGDRESLDFFHPEISLVQTIADPSDPIHYLRTILREPRPGSRPKSILLTEGVNPDGTGDTYTPPRTTEIQAIALGVPPQEPLLHSVESLAWSDLVPTKLPAQGISGNLAEGRATGILAQWRASLASNGHYVLYDIPEAGRQAEGFMRGLADDPKGHLPAP